MFGDLPETRCHHSFIQFPSLFRLPRAPNIDHGRPHIPLEYRILSVFKAWPSKCSTCIPWDKKHLELNLSILMCLSKNGGYPWLPQNGKQKTVIVIDHKFGGIFRHHGFVLVTQLPFYGYTNHFQTHLYLQLIPTWDLGVLLSQ